MIQMILRGSLIALILTHAFLFVPSAGSLPSGSPEKAGFSRERIERFAPFMQQYVNEGKVAGPITILLSQYTPFGHYPSRARFQTLVYQAIID